MALALALIPLACSRPDTVLARTPSSKRPANVVIIALDTLRADHLGCYGYARATSPNLDRLARESFLFENAMSSAPWTAPALISLMTSLYPAVHGVRDTPERWRMSETVTTLAEILKGRGYATAAFTEGGYARGDFGLDQGFDLYPANPEDTTSVHSILGQASRIRENVDRTLDWVRQRGDAPFLLFFHTYEVHAPYRAPAEYVRRFLPGFDDAAEHEAARHAIVAWNEKRTIDREGCLVLARHERRCHTFADLPKMEEKWVHAEQATLLGCGAKQILEDPAFTDHLRDLYDAGILHTDEQVERLFVALREQGQLESTIVVVVSDHGEGLGEHGELEHGQVFFDEILRIALLMRVPAALRRGLPHAGRVEPVVRSVDVLPTLLELLGIDETGIVLQGKSMVPLMRGGVDDRAAFSHARTVPQEKDTQESVRSGSWRLIADPAIDTAELYDLRADPTEVRNVAERHPEVVARLKLLLDRQRERDEALRREVGAEMRQIELDAETLGELRRLGYLGSDG